jgi:Protein of unknown function (DUF2795)
MERESSLHGPRVDDELAKEVDSLTHGAPIESRIEENRTMEEDAAERDPEVEFVVAHAGDRADDTGITHRETLERSELGRHLRPSLFPADRDAVIACAIAEDAPSTLVTQLRGLPERTYDNTEAVWEALGGHHERSPRAQPRPAHGDDRAQPDDRPPPVERFRFEFDWRYRLAALPLAITPDTAFVEVDRRGEPVLRARFGVWLLETPCANVVDTTRTGPYSFVKTVGPPHLSLADLGVTFATNGASGLCICFRTPVAAIDPLGVVRHPALTVTVADVDGLARSLAASR